MTEALISLLTSLHVLGVGLGAGAVSFAEFAYLRAIRDGRIDECEKHYLRTLFWGLKFGMTTVLVSGLVLIGLSFSLSEPPAAFYDPGFWMQHTLTLVILGIGSLLASRTAPWWFGAGFVFAAWWMMLVLHALPLLPVSYLGLVMWYLLAGFIASGVLAFLRGLIPTKNGKR